MLFFLGLRNGESSNSSKEFILTTLQTEGLIYFKAPFDAGYRRSWLAFGGIAYVMRGGTYICGVGMRRARRRGDIQCDACQSSTR
jgi:hypothetical protein